MERQRKVIWVLFEKDICRGVYTSARGLKKGIDHWMKERPDKILHYIEYWANYPQAPLCWDWAYIPVGTKTRTLTAGGGCAPKKEFFGKNIVNGYTAK